MPPGTRATRSATARAFVLLGWGLLLVLLGVLVLASLRAYNLWSMGRIGWYPGEVQRFEADPQRGYRWPFRLYVPASWEQGPGRIWVRPNNTSVGAHADFSVHDEDAGQLLAVSRREAEALGAVVLVPSFPRPAQPRWLYTHALDRDSVSAEGSEATAGELERLDLQLLAMIDAARAALKERGRTSCEDVLIDGFSASAMFANRWSLIHPQRVAAVAVGAPGGWPMVPAASHQGEALSYPAGTADFEALFGVPFPAEQVRQTPMLLFLGAEDRNDSVPYTDGWDPEQAERLSALFGDSPVQRWPHAERLFEGFDARFVLYEDLGHHVDSRAREQRTSFLAEHDQRGGCPGAR